MNPLSPVVIDQTFLDPNLIRRFGNLTTLSVSEVLLSARAYVEQSSEAQRSVISTSDFDQAGESGAARVRIKYLTSAYELKTEDVDLEGTTRVPTSGTDIRFIEKFHVIKGASAKGAIKLLETASGAQTEFCGIGVGTFDAFLCHHYVPAGRNGYVCCWGASADDQVKFKLMGRSTYGSDIVDEHWDLINLMGITTPPGFLIFDKPLCAVPFQEKAYIRINVVPAQDTTTTIRGELLVWEQDNTP